MKRAFIYLITFVAIQLVVTYAVIIPWLACDSSMLQALADIAEGNISFTAPMLLVTSTAYSVVVLIVFLWARWCRLSPSYLRTRPWGVFFWVVIAALGTLLPSHALLEWLNLPDVNAALFAEMLSSPWGYVALCLLAPLAEEVVFRGAILRSLMGSLRSSWVAIALSAILFALVHANPAQMPHAFLIGLLMGWMYYRTGSILPGVLLHWVNNTVAYVSVNIMPGMSDMTLEQVFGSTQRVLMAVGFSLCLLLPAIFQLQQRMRHADHA